jgi:N-acyl-L-homoserine lactone synthetase
MMRVRDIERFQRPCHMRVVEVLSDDIVINTQIKEIRKRIWEGKFHDEKEEDEWDGTCQCAYIALLWQDVVVGSCRILIGESIADLPMGEGLDFKEDRYGYVLEVSRFFIETAHAPYPFTRRDRLVLHDYLVRGIEGLMQFNETPWAYASVREPLLLGLRAIGVTTEVIGESREHAHKRFIPVKMYRRKRGGVLAYRHDEAWVKEHQTLSRCA